MNSPTSNPILLSLETQLSKAPLPPGEGLGRGFGRSVWAKDSRLRLQAPPEPSSGALRHLLTRKGTPTGSPEGEGTNQLRFEANQEPDCPQRPTRQPHRSGRVVLLVLRIRLDSRQAALALISTIAYAHTD